MPKRVVRTIEPGMWLACGCCAASFQTWEGYVDQDQDRGYGICKPCQDWHEERNKKEYDKMFDMLLGAMKPDTRAKIEAKVEEDPEMKIVYVNRAIEQGFFTWKIGKAS